MPKAPPNAAMNMTELAEFLKVSRATLWKPARVGKVPPQNVGRHPWFHCGAVAGWLRWQPVNR